VIAIAIKQLFPVGGPHRIGTAAGRDLNFWSRSRIGLRVDLISAGLIRAVSDPVAVRRELWRTLHESGCREGPRLAIPIHFQDPNVGFLEFMLHKVERPTVRRPGGSPLAGDGVEQALLRSAA